MTAVVAELQIEYIRTLLGRLRQRDATVAADALCDRIEANLDALLELVVEAPPVTLTDAVAAVEAAEDRVLDLALAHAASQTEVAPPVSPAEAEPGDAAAIVPELAPEAADEPEIEDPVSPLARAAANMLDEILAEPARESDREDIPAPMPAEYSLALPPLSESESPTAPAAAHEPEPDAPAAAAAPPAPSVPDAASRRSQRPARPLGPPTVACEPGCGERLPEGLEFAEHRRGCAEYQAAVTPRVTVLPGVTTAPLPETAPDVIAARDAFQERRLEQASRAAKANRGVVARAVPVPEVDVLRRKRGGRGSYGVDGLTDVQRETIESLRATRGNMAATARATNRESKQVRVTIDSLRLSGRLPADVAELLDARRQEFPGTGAE